MVFQVWFSTKKIFFKKYFSNFFLTDDKKNINVRKFCLARNAICSALKSFNTLRRNTYGRKKKSKGSAQEKGESQKEGCWFWISPRAQR